MNSNYERREGDSFSSFRKNFPTLFVGITVLFVTVLLLGGRSVITSVSAQLGTGQPEIPVTNSSSAGNFNTTNVNTTNGDPATMPAAEPEIRDGVQYVTSTMDARSYEPIRVQQGVPVKWTLNVPEGALNGCNDAIIIPSYGLQVSLQPGENLIEFTPDESGIFVFSCWMGMLRSGIIVVGEDGTVAQNQNDGTDQLPAGCSSSGCCGG